MDVIPWAIALIVAIVQPSLKRAVIAGVAASVGVRLVQVWVVEPATWGKDIPEDLFGGLAMIALTVCIAWIGSLARQAVVRTREAS